LRSSLPELPSDPRSRAVSAGERGASGMVPSVGTPRKPSAVIARGRHMTVTSGGVDAAPFQDLAAALRGDLIEPGDSGYDEARAVYNGMIDKRPAAIARCRDAADVVSCVRFGREHGVEIAVRGGGHNAGGLGVADDALV